MQQHKIVYGITGSISAYKSTGIARLFSKEGHDVQIIMTASAKDFITPLTLATLSTKPVLSDWFDQANGYWHNHVDLGLWADLILIAPASANTLAKMANGFCDNLLLGTYLSAKCPVVVAPAMDHDMWHHPATQRNIQQIQSDGVHVIPPAHGELASGLIGDGRLPEAEDVVAQAMKVIV